MVEYLRSNGQKIRSLIACPRHQGEEARASKEQPEPACEMKCYTYSRLAASIIKAFGCFYKALLGFRFN